MTDSPKTTKPSLTHDRAIVRICGILARKDQGGQHTAGDPVGLSLGEKAIKRAVRRIEYEIVIISEEGFESKDSWYALDRIGAIRNVCDQLLAGNKLACVSGLGTEDEAEAIATLDDQAG